MRCPRCTAKLIEDRPTCPQCGWVRPVRQLQPNHVSLTAGWRSPDDIPPINTSGTGLPPPLEVRKLGYCWGGFALPFSFSWANNIAIGCLLSGLVIQLWLGKHGHEAAWKNRRFESFDQFRATMRVWDRRGKAVFFGVLVVWAVLVIVLVGTFMAARHAG